MSRIEQTQFPDSRRKMSLVTDIWELFSSRRFVTLMLFHLWAKARDGQEGTKDGAVLGPS